MESEHLRFSACELIAVTAAVSIMLASAANDGLPLLRRFLLLNVGEAVFGNVFVDRRSFVDPV
jgi:hypothetical protein